MSGNDNKSGNRLLIKVTRDTLPQVKEKYPFLYLESPQKPTTALVR